MPTTVDTGHDPGDLPEIEARLRAELGAGGLPPTVRARQRERLTALAHELGPPATAGDDAQPTVPSAVAGPGSASARAQRRWSGRLASPRLAAASLAAIAVLTAGAGTSVAASDDALPGDALHGVKLVVDHVRTTAAWDADDEVAAHLDVAERRFAEAERLVAGEGDPAQLPATLERYAEALHAAAGRAGDDRELTASVDAATAEGQRRLTALLDGETADTPGARQALHDVLERLRATRSGEGGSPLREERGDDLVPPGFGPGESPPGERGAPGERGPGEAPGRPDDAGPPGEPGPPADPGRPNDTGPPDDAGPPDQSSAPEDAGPPADPGPPDDTGPPDQSSAPEDAGPPADPGPPDDPGPPEQPGPAPPQSDPEADAGSGGGADPPADGAGPP